jgi:hypothetical protein
MYLDDVIMIGHIFQEHLLNLQKVFPVLRSPPIAKSGEVPTLSEGMSDILCHPSGKPPTPTS